MKKRILTLMVFLMCVAAGCSGNQGEAEVTAESGFPEGTIEIINPYPAGGATDTVTRVVAKVLPDYLPNKPEVIVMNNPLGGAGTIGTAKLINSKPDGYTIAMTPISTLAVHPHLGQVDYSYDDVKPIIEVSSSEGMLVVPSDAPYKTFEEWVEYVKTNPGEFNYSTAGAGSLQHIQAESLINSAGIDIQHVPYDGTAESTTALLGGHVDGAVMQLSQARDHIEEGVFRPLVYLGSSKAKGYEDVPLLSEVGIDMSIDNFTLFFTNKEVPDETFTILEEAFVKAMNDPAVQEVIENAGDTPQGTTGEDLQDKVKATFEASGEAMKASGLID